MNVLKDDLKRLLILWQLFKVSLECIRTSDTIKEWAEIAKANKNKNFVDFRALAAAQLNSLNAMIFKMKSTMRPETWNAIMSTLTSEQIKEVDLLLNEITELREDAIERITTQIKEAKLRSGIPLNNPEEQAAYEKDNSTENTGVSIGERPTGHGDSCS
jgi:hypothetical protein